MLMKNRIQRAVMMGLLIAAGVGGGACAPPLGMACGDGWCPEGFLCMPSDLTCIKSECGNAVVEAGEECDDGNLNDDDDCLSTCKLSTCGDGKVNLRTEECDDGNLDDEDDCLSTCKLNTCGDGKVDLSTEECDDGNSSNEDDCLVTCKRNTCGDGFLDQQSPNLEACDDGNTKNDDGCNNDCTVSLLTYIKASNTDAGDRFGISIALSADGSTLAVGASEEDSCATGIGGSQADNSCRDSGAVYVFTHSGTTWRQQAYIKPSGTGPGASFGSSVALSADGATLTVGAPGGYPPSSSRVYVLTRSGTTWSQQASNPDSGDGFGQSVALSADGSTKAVGAFGEDSAATGIGGNQADYSARNSGAVYVYPLPAQQ